jgi:PAS domain S-box-containing protein
VEKRPDDATQRADRAVPEWADPRLKTLVAELIRRRQRAEAMCETLTRVLEATSDGFVALDAEWRYTYVNGHAGQMFGRNPESLVGKHIWTEFPEGRGHPFHLAYERAVREGVPVQIEAYYPPYERWFENRIFPYAGGVAVFFQDVTARHLAEERLRESEQRYRSLFDNHPDAIYSFDSEGRFVSANAACQALTGYELAELVGTPFLPLVVTEHRDRAVAHFETAMSGQSCSYEESIIHKGGRRVDIRITKLPIIVDGKTVGVYGIAHDLTKQRALESRLQQAEKLEAVGRLAAGIAHDFNNVLTVVHSCASLINQALPADSPIHSDVDEIQSAVKRARDMTQQLLAFGRRQALEPTRVDVNALVSTFVTTLRHVIPERISIDTRFDANVPPALADPGQVERVLMNLAVNARDAMPNGGTLSLRTERTATGDVSISVEDTGTGIDAALLPRIFDPFVTTKPHDVGTGLGLATAYGIVEQTGGTISVSSEAGRGSRFAILLPHAAPE